MNHSIDEKLCLEYTQQIMDEVAACCKAVLLNKYGEAVPRIITDRLDKELEFLSANPRLASLCVLSKRILNGCYELGHLQGARGSLGSLFIAYLMGITEVNPLPPHFHCRECGHVEFVDVKKFYSGYDLTSKHKPCPICDSRMHGDGHNIPHEIFATSPLSFDFNTSGNIKEHYKDIVDMCGQNQVFLAPIGVRWDIGTRLMIIPPYDTYILDHTELFHIDNGIRYINIENDVSEFAFYIVLLYSDIFQKLKALENATGIQISDIDVSEIDIEKIKSETNFEEIMELSLPTKKEKFPPIKAKTYSDILKFYGLIHGTGAWNNNGETLLRKGHPLSEIIVFRDDIMNDLLHQDIDLGSVLSIIKKCQLGKGHLLSAEEISILKKQDIPNWYINSIKKITYLFPKAHAVEYTISHLRLMWYKINYPKEYTKATCGI